MKIMKKYEVNREVNTVMIIQVNYDMYNKHVRYSLLYIAS